MNDMPANLARLGSTVATPERRLVLQVIERWREAAGGARFPRLSAFDLAALGDRRKHCYRLDLTEGMADPRLTLVGAALVADCGMDPTGLPVSAVPPGTLLSKSLDHVPLAVERRAPVSLGGMFRHADGREVLFRTVILPLAGDDGGIAGLIGAANHRPVDTG